MRLVWLVCQLARICREGGRGGEGSIGGTKGGRGRRQTHYLSMIHMQQHAEQAFNVSDSP